MLTRPLKNGILILRNKNMKKSLSKFLMFFIAISTIACTQNNGLTIFDWTVRREILG